QTCALPICVSILGAIASHAPWAIVFVAPAVRVHHKNVVLKVSAVAIQTTKQPAHVLSMAVLNQNLRQLYKVVFNQVPGSLGHNEFNFQHRQRPPNRCNCHQGSARLSRLASTPGESRGTPRPASRCTPPVSPPARSALRRRNPGGRSREDSSPPFAPIQ